MLDSPWVLLQVTGLFRVLCKRVPYYAWHLKRDTNLENYPHLLRGSWVVKSGVMSYKSPFLRVISLVALLVSPLIVTPSNSK